MRWAWFSSISENWLCGTWLYEMELANTIRHNQFGSDNFQKWCIAFCYKKKIKKPSAHFGCLVFIWSAREKHDASIDTIRFIYNKHAFCLARGESLFIFCFYVYIFFMYIFFSGPRQSLLNAPTGDPRNWAIGISESRSGVRWKL